MKEYFVYILSNFTNSTLYVGITNDLRRRLYEHKNNLIPGFTEKYNIHKLVYFEKTTDVKAAIVSNLVRNFVPEKSHKSIMLR